MILLIIFAFCAGFITILSPCILPIAPILLTAGTEHNYYKPIGIIIGLIISFSFFTLSLTSIVKVTNISPDAFRYIALIIIVFSGLTMIIPSFENLFTQLTTRITRVGSSIQEHSIQIKTSFISGLLLGIALGLIWTPCAGPILGAITTLAATNGITLTTVFITIAYSCGAAVPMLLLTFGSAKIIHSTTALSPYSHTIRQLFGIVVILSAVAIFFHADVIIQQRLARFFPTITLENSALLHTQLNMLQAPLTEQNISEQKAPEIIGISEWFNTTPLSLAQLKGKVVLLDFWTYTCINCIRTLPHITQWYNDYKNKGLEIIGIHTPEFAFEKNSKHVQDAIKRFNITYPIALDNDYKTWQAYNNRYWPAHYLINQNGIIVKTHFGEGNYEEMENAIRQLLALPPLSSSTEQQLIHPTTPETYLGFERAQNYNPSMILEKNKIAIYSYTANIINDHVGLQGPWLINSDKIHAKSNECSLTLNFLAQHVCIVMESPKPQQVTVLLDNKPVPTTYHTKDMDKNGHILVKEPRMYEIIDLKNDYGRHLLTLQFQKETIAYVFTFG